MKDSTWKFTLKYQSGAFFPEQKKIEQLLIILQNQNVEPLVESCKNVIL